jgi:hypothetical protein
MKLTLQSVPGHSGVRHIPELTIYPLWNGTVFGMPRQQAEALMRLTYSNATMLAALKMVQALGLRSEVVAVLDAAVSEAEAL